MLFATTSDRSTLVDQPTITAAARIPSVSETRTMRHDEEDIDPHQPEMPDTRCVVPPKSAASQ